jgi:cell division protein FtsI/penicillin-binding protein 2
MRDVISGSDAAYNIKTHFYGVDYSIGGKSGTAQAGSNASNNAWFTGFAPLDDPQITVTCMIEHGASGGNSAYTVREIMDAFFGS